MFEGVHGQSPLKDPSTPDAHRAGPFGWRLLLYYYDTLRKQRCALLLSCDAFQLPGENMSCFHRCRGLTLSKSHASLPSYFWIDYSALATGSCATDVTTRVRYELSRHVLSIFVSSLKWTGFGNPRHHQKGAFYERNQYLFWCFFRSDLDRCPPSSVQNTNRTNPNAGLRITNGVSGLRSNHTSI